MNTKCNWMVTAGCALLLCLPVVAFSEDDKIFNGTVSGEIKFATDYVFRGESETSDGDIPAVQGSLTWVHESNWYFGYFGSTNKFPSAPDIYAVVGPYLGKSGEAFETRWRYNVFVFHYMYPGTKDYDYTELWTKVGTDVGSLDLEFEVTPTLNDWFGVEGWKGVNYAVHPSYALKKNVKLSGSVGKQTLSGEGAEGWMHWNLGANYSRGRISIDARYHDSDVTSDHKVYGSPEGLSIFKERFVLAVSKSI